MPRMNPTIVKTDSDSSNQNSKKQTKTSKSTITRKKKSETNTVNNKEKKQRKKRESSVKYYTHEGHSLTVKEAKFIDLYIETGNGRQSVIQAGYSTNAPGQYATKLINKDYISREITYRLKLLETEKIASAEEIMKYFTSVMRGEVTDQFGLDAPLAERTKAAQELAKRKIDIANKVSGKEVGEVKISLTWDGIKEEDI